MKGQVLEISSSDAINTVKILRAAKEQGKVSLQEIELYGSLVHVVAPDVEKEKNTIQKLLKNEEIHVEEMALIEASLEDVFIASMK